MKYWRPANLRAVFAVWLSALAWSTAAAAATERVIHSFNAFLHGGNPQASVVADASGNLYGTASTGGSVNGGVAFKLTPTGHGQWTETILHDFTGGSDGFQPMSGLVFDKSGNLFGTTYAGGQPTCGNSFCGPGLVYELSPGANGAWTEKIIYTFQGVNHGISDGSSPQGNLILDSQGNLYGTTAGGGRTCYCGTVFELSPNNQGSWQEKVLYAFNGQQDGYDPQAGVIFDAAGNLYGTTYGSANGGVNCSGQCGTLFELSPVGGSWTQRTLYTFRGGSDGANPTGVILNTDGALYGTTTYGNGYGAVFKLTSSSGGSWTETILPVTVVNPVGGLVADAFGNLYGTSSGSVDSNYCTNGCGTVFKVSATSGGGWKMSVLYNFAGNLDGAYPAASLILDAAGDLYGTTASGAGINCTYAPFGNTSGCGTVFKLSLSANGKWQEKELYTFPGSDGLFASGMTLDSAGNLYGSTYLGGAYGYGEVFKLTPSNGNWVGTTLYSFTGGTDGANPNPVILDAEGNVYGSTEGGGGLLQCGVVFKLSSSSGGTWKETVLHTFPGGGGCVPVSNLVFDSSGNLYGETNLGGGAACSVGYNGCGTIFKLAPTGGGPWTQTVLHRFPASTTDGLGPWGGLSIDAAGNIFGTTYGGGANCNSGGYCGGTAFELTSNSEYSVLYNFQITTGSASTPNGVMPDNSGNLYGTSGGGQYGYGTVFELSPLGTIWNLIVLYQFTGGSDGLGPAGVILDASHNLYGVTYAGGSASAGTVYELSSSAGSWTLNELYNFKGSSDGAWPNTNLVRDSLGNLYGATQFGGNSLSQGVVFEIEK
jgi:uncharacterized repeat protein (TIGR03803 family)